MATGLKGFWQRWNISRRCTESRKVFFTRPVYFKNVRLQLNILQEAGLDFLCVCEGSVVYRYDVNSGEVGDAMSSIANLRM